MQIPVKADQLNVQINSGAKTRAGHPCKQTAIYTNGRCKFHEGLSTGPVTPEGKKRFAASGQRPKRNRSP